MTDSKNDRIATAKSYRSAESGKNCASSKPFRFHICTLICAAIRPMSHGPVTTVLITTEFSWKGVRLLGTASPVRVNWLLTSGSQSSLSTHLILFVLFESSPVIRARDYSICDERHLTLSSALPLRVSATNRENCVCIINVTSR
jgi:hypothetical protein